MQSFTDAVDTSALHSQVLVLGGSDDLLNPIAALRDTWQSIDDTQWVEISSAGHALHWDQPEAVVNAVTRFLKKG